jgi:hypothetical protein
VQAGIIVLAVFGFVAFVLWLMASHVRAKIRHRTELQKELIAKFSSPQELAAFLDSDAGKALLRGATAEPTVQWKPPPPRPVNEQCGITIAWGILGLCVGAGIFVARGLTLPGAVFVALGVGFVINGLLRLVFDPKART